MSRTKPRLDQIFVITLLLGGLVFWFFGPARTALDSAAVKPAEYAVVAPGNPLQPIVPLTAIQNLPPERVALGRRLFHDSRLSADFSLACASCHKLDQGGADGRQFSLGIGGDVGQVNAPTVLNSGYSLAQFWDGRAASLEEQAAGPVHNPIEMGSNWAQVLSRLEQDASFKAAFLRAYPDGLTANNLADAIGTFERSLVTLNSRFDRYLRGEPKVLSNLEIDGYRLFRDFGCISCHQGALVGGNMYQKFGVLGNYFQGRPTTTADLGRYNVTQRDEDRHVFKVPSLRNVAMTAPYFHDGSADSLAQAVEIMARYQLGRELLSHEIEAIVAFLNTLSGELPVMDRL